MDVDMKFLNKVERVLKNALNDKNDFAWFTLQHVAIYNQDFFCALIENVYTQMGISDAQMIYTNLYNDQINLHETLESLLYTIECKTNEILAKEWGYHKEK